MRLCVWSTLLWFLMQVLMHAYSKRFGMACQTYIGLTRDICVSNLKEQGKYYSSQMRVLSNFATRDI